ncbi:hypothetical protein NVP1161O_109 [Vibrio phage 1.161.O._10N.261.48.C5]|nr:hypothetical protein NVP1161O_109 [Vibrio phage 1.161.O._10N.261.48.C5]
MIIYLKNFPKDFILNYKVSDRLDFECAKGKYKPFLDQAFENMIKKDLNFDNLTGTVFHGKDWQERFSSLEDWEGLDIEDQDPLWFISKHVKCEASTLYNKSRV